MPEPELARAVVLAREHIICVDDEEAILNVLRQQLARFEDEWDIDLARSAEEALDLADDLEREGESVAMVIADQIMPGMKGVELLERIHERHPDSVKILLTGQAAMDAVIRAINHASLDRFIAKPWDEQDLRLSVAGLLNSYRLAQENRRLLLDLTRKNEELLRLNRNLDLRVKQRTHELDAVNRSLEHANHSLGEANRRLSRLAITDGLTGLYNHRYFHERLGKEVERSNRTGLPLSLLMIDVDHFKHYNDVNGHPAGDGVLRNVAQLLAEGRRLNDAVARYGGEEFTVLLVDTPRDSAVRVAHQLRHRVDEAQFPNEQAQPLGKLTISLGVASFPADASTADGLVAAADDALYRAKHAGRNGVGIA